MNEKELQFPGEMWKKLPVKALVTAALVGAAAAAIVFAAACFLAHGNDTICRGVSTLGTNLSGMTVQQAAAALEQTVVRAPDRAGITFSADTGSTYRSYAELGFALSCEETAQRLHNWGHSGNALADGWHYLQGLLGKKTKLAPIWTEDETISAAAAKDIARVLSREAVDFSHSAQESGVYVVKPCDGCVVTTDAVVQVCRAQVAAGTELSPHLAVAYENIPAQQGDLSAVQQAYSGPCRSAYYDKQSDRILSETAHAEFSLEEAQAKLDAADAGETVRIAAAAECPTVTAEELERVLFRDKLSTYTTRVTGAPGRHENVRVTAEKLDGVVLNHGESVKYSELVMPFSLENGYHLAPMYVRGKTVDGVGGGACQASSTLYAAALYANLEIVQRINHGFASDYIGLGLDATVAEGGPEFEVRNDTDYPIRIDARFETKEKKDYITVDIIGTKVDDRYVKVRTEVLSTTPYSEQIIETDELAPGESVVEQTPYTGYLVKTYREIYEGDGTLVSSTLEATSRYNARDRITKVGKASAPTMAETPVEQPEEGTPPEEEAPAVEGTPPQEEAPAADGTLPEEVPAQDISAETEAPAQPPAPVQGTVEAASTSAAEG